MAAPGSGRNGIAIAAQALTGRTRLVTRERAYHGGSGLARDVTLQPQPAVNRIPAGSDTTFLVTFQNQGASDETNVKVTVRISGAGTPIVVNKTVPQTVAGANAEVEIPLGQSPPIGTPVTIKVTVNKVPGEQKTDNNTADYTALFTR